MKTDRMQPQVNQNYTTIINLEKIGKDKNTDGVISQLIRKEEGGGKVKRSENVSQNKRITMLNALCCYFSYHLHS